MKKQILILAAMLIAAQSQAQKFDLQGQRGARGIMPENTIQGMIKALDLGVNTLVMNAVISKDKQVVLSQEPYFNAEISLKPDGKAISLKDQKKYNIYKMNYEEIKKFDVGSKIHNRFPGQQKFKVSKPLLEETLDSVEAYVKENRLPKPNYSIETKLIPKGDGEFQPEPAEFVDLIMEIVKRKKLEKRVTIQSFDIRTLQYLHENYPKVKTGLLIDEKEDFENNIQELGFKPTVYSPYSVLVGKSLVDRCHEAGIKIIPWTINSTKEMKYLIGLGVDGLVTDYPNLFKAELLKGE
ncbi:glycerophosphodiester phosphodiesterase family protein [Pedobacter sp. PLR]|uniref:glycerophosphodiester phosphodiesterase family protein n=1 Tax=Pedobacter sp. PLR TaxID=2994465 RepID=UPI002248433E|nr:glycerophosphodiester phosphodiesterase family protein [Pedobacter sp. PLR]MCX2450656.1 glycerophosphodiester phosphodiesterase family protein [Pedobacter sp. PLR]